MSEYPIHCNGCGKYLMLVHATEWNDRTLCDECWRKKYPNGREDYE